MLELSKVDKIVKKVAAVTLKRKVVRVHSERMADFEGQEALRVYIVLKRGSREELTGDMIPETLNGVDEALQAANDDRFPYIRYRTEGQLKPRDDAEC